MRDLLQQIQSALNSNLYYLALYVSLTIPDIGAALDSADGRTTGARYRSWFNQYAADKFTTERMLEKTSQDIPAAERQEFQTNFPQGTQQRFTAEDCWHFRCSLLHQGSSQNKDSAFERIVFFEPGPTTTHLLHLNDRPVNGQRTLIIDVTIFCQELIESAEQWLQKVEPTARYKNNYDRFMRRHPRGLPPDITGMPVIG